MKLYTAIALPPELLGEKARQLLLQRALHPGDQVLKRHMDDLHEQIKGVVSSQERCEEFLQECVSSGLVPRKLRRWKPGAAPLHKWEKGPAPEIGPGKQYVKVIQKHRGGTP